MADQETASPVETEAQFWDGQFDATSTLLPSCRKSTVPFVADTCFAQS